MTHVNAPLSLEGRRRLVERCRTRPIAHVAARSCGARGRRLPHHDPQHGNLCRQRLDAERCR
ncbi:hypothetical protein C1I99_26515 [Micromonospora deserti]|uniref:Uncharacterized protein n=1 Tax=Micromonospora deserti TaxID=2070366 RepID=A0A2W2C6K4_9ACTN|nr:hypothetical protein C1I99_26515 [Micromonospora deserti]